MTFYYPPLDETTMKNLEVVRQLVQAHPGYFLESEYSAQIDSFLISWFREPKRKVGAVSEETPKPKVEDTRDAWKMLYEESRDLFTQLKEVEIEDEGTTAERMTYFRTATALLEKMVSLQERAHSLKDIGDFQRTVLNIMDSVLTPTQRTTVMSELEKFTTSVSGENK